MSIRLPFIAVLLSYTLLAALTTLTYLSLRTSEQQGAVRIPLPHGGFTLHRPDFLLASAYGAGSFASRAVQAANFPGMIGECVADVIMRTWPDSWRPHIFGPEPGGLFIWRGFIFPLYCLPFWWFGGLGLDAFLNRRRLHWTVLLLGTLLAAFFAFITIGLAITTGIRDYDDMAFVFCGLLPWTTLLALFPITWWRTFRRNRKLRSPKLDLQPEGPSL